MSRLYLSLLFLFFCFTTLFSQNKVKKYVKFADEQYSKGDYYYALEYYKLALEADSNNIDFLWKYAETLRAYKDYKEAEKFYLKVYKREKTKKYPYSLLYYGLMQKQNKSYSKAIETFKLAKKKYQSDENSYLYKKSIREIESCDWAIKNLPDSLEILVSTLPSTVNSTNAEFPHIVRDGQLIFSSLRADSITSKEEVYSREYKTKLYTSKIKDGKFEQNELLDSIILENKSRGNGAFSLDGKIFYFSLCEDQAFNYKCEIWYSYYENGKFSQAKALGNDINLSGSNTTMPSIGLINNREVLFFSSDRNGESKGMDLFYAFVNTGGTTFSNITQLDQINTPDGDITPWFDLSVNRLYFSSSWHNGFGGQDIYYSEVKEGSFNSPINAGWPLNSPANDQYFFINNDSIYLASNRIGSSSIKNPTCCSDIFSSVSSPAPFDSIIDTIIITSIISQIQRDPVRLYFHNDRPNAWSWDTITKLNYIETYEAYKELLPTYKRIYPQGLNPKDAQQAELAIDDFFSNKVDKGIEDLKVFTKLILEELNKGAKLKLSLRGFASPLAPTDYNVSLTKRRISSFVNYLKQYENGVFVPYLNRKANNGGELTVEFSPFGEYKADQTTSDNPKDEQKSVFSIAAAIERRIEIESVSFLNVEDQFPILAPKSVFNAGSIQRGQLVGSFFTVENISEKNVSLKEILKSSENVSFEIDKKELKPGESALVKMYINTKAFKGLSSESISISVDGYTEKQVLTINFEAQ
jgi:tetratricopeptide (TPR) repeat protein/outer membrane protein OmpA-like peptidoglycan-associated protein